MAAKTESSQKQHIHSNPFNGLANEVFADMGGKEDLLIVLQCADKISEEQVSAIWDNISAFEKSVKLSEGRKLPYDHDPKIGSDSVRVRIHGAVDPVAAGFQFVEAIAHSGVIIVEQFFVRWRQLPGQELWGPVPHPRAKESAPGYPSEDAYMNAVFDLSVAQPPSEIHYELKGAITKSNGDYILEDRGMPLFAEGIRICYGTAPDKILAADKRTESIQSSLISTLDEDFKDMYYPPGQNWRPIPYNRAGKKGIIDRIAYNGREGIGFALAAGDLLNLFNTENLRYREQELMDSLAKLIKEHQLAPIITWNRVSKPLMGPISKPSLVIIQLWEPA